MLLFQPIHLTIKIPIYLSLSKANSHCTGMEVGIVTLHTCCKYTITIVRITAPAAEWSARLQSTLRICFDDVLLCKAKCEPVVLICVADTGNFFYIVVTASGPSTLNHTQLCFMLTRPWQGQHVGQTCCTPLWWATVLCWLATCGTMRSFPVLWPRASQKCRGILMLIHVLSQHLLQEWSRSSFFNSWINWYKCNSFGSSLGSAHSTPNRPHCSSFSTDPSTLLLEEGRQVVLGHHLTLNYWLNRHFLCCLWMCWVRHAAQVLRCFTANVHLVGTFTVLPKLFVTSGQEVARVVFCQISFGNEDESLPYSLIIMTPLDPLTWPLICQWLHCSSSTDPSLSSLMWQDKWCLDRTWCWHVTGADFH